MRKTILFLFLILSLVQIYGQERSQQNDSRVYLPLIEKQYVEDKIARDAKTPLYEFAILTDVDYTTTNSGIWTELPNGDRVWKLRFTSDNAKNIHFWIRNFFIPKGALLYAYPEGHRQEADIYDSLQNNNPSYFGIWPISGGDVWLEYYEPGNVKGLGRFELFKAGLGYQNVATKSTNETLSLSCNFDVECFMDGIENIKNHCKKSVTMILGGTDEGAFLASGALINNTLNDGTPYILSANHAWVDTAMYTFRFHWINPNPDCPSSGWGDQSINENQTVSGATLRARRAQTDFLLMEINTDLPEEWNLVWSGWDRSGIPSLFTFGIHHPAGDIMKICRDFDSPEILDEDNGDIKWLINNWEIGTTEGGSSGSPLYTDQGEIIGQLWAGASACNGSNPNGALDVYGRFDVSWNAGITPDTRLKEWLDPADTGQLSVGFYPPLPTYSLDGEIRFIDQGTSICGDGIESVIRIVNNGSSVISQAVIQYSINDNTPQNIYWEGNLSENEAEVLYLPNILGDNGNNSFVVNLLSINGVSDENQENDILEANFVKRIVPDNQIVLEILTDNFGEDISWQLTNENGAVLYSGDSYDDNQLYTQDMTLPNGCYLFSISDSYGDGLCCTQGNGYYSLTYNGILLQGGGDMGSGESINFKVEGELSIDKNSIENVKIYPNPSKGIYNIQLIDEGKEYILYNQLGQTLKVGSLNSKENILDISFLPTGIYKLWVGDISGDYTKFTLLKE